MIRSSDEPYLTLIERKVDDLLKIASEARRKGVDVSNFVETEKANTLSERVVALFGHPELGERTSYWLSRGWGKRELSFKMADEIMSGTVKFDFSPSEKAELAIRVGLAIMTGAIVSAPVEGINKVTMRRNPEDGTHYLSIYFNGPIRTAGGTDGALCVVLADYIRRKMGLAPYKPGEREVGRYLEEVSLYRRVGRLQYKAKPEEVRFVAKRLPVEVTGPPTERVEVTSYRNLRTVETNRLRGGGILVLNDCVLQKASKLGKAISDLRTKGFELEGWEWLRDFETRSEELEKGREGCSYIKPIYKYMSEAVVGRPVLSYPGRRGGFRLRYGHSRVTGLASSGLHPATMVVLDEFIAVGTQVRTERPGKSSIIMPVDCVEGPIVRLKDGSVVRLETEAMAREVADQVDSILFLGDVLVGFGEFLQNNHPLLPSAWVEEWWIEMAESAAKEKGVRLPSDLVDSPIGNAPGVDDAVRLSLLLSIPLHPRWTYFWHDISLGDLSYLFTCLKKAEMDDDMIRAEMDERLKAILEALGVPHHLEGQSIVVQGGDAKALLITLGGLEGEIDEAKYTKWSTINAINDLSPIRIMLKAPFYIGMRVGRPEKAKPREMKPSVNLLFPLGLLKGRSRFLINAYKKGPILIDVAVRRCPRCGKMSASYYCRECSSRTVLLYFCPMCGRELNEGGRCPVHRVRGLMHKEISLDLKQMLDEAIAALGGMEASIPLEKVRGVIGLTSGEKHPEPVEKGLLRAKYDLSVFKDGTCRFDSTNAVLTHFTPEEIGAPVRKLKEIGYTHDVDGKALQNSNQLLELKMNDVIIPEDAAEYFVRVANFLNEELMRFYGLPAFYNVDEVADLIGHILFVISPHIFTLNPARIIGFTAASVTFAHPFLHSAKRRNADGDEDSLILGLDVLLNFSRKYLPSKPGGREDAPLLLITTMDLKYIDEESYNIEEVSHYPLEFYQATLAYKDPSEIEGSLISTVGTKYRDGDEYPSMAFTHAVSRIAQGPLTSLYRRLDRMTDKLEGHVSLETKIGAVDKEDSISRAISAHFLRDISGNLRKFSMQGFRCSKCNAKYRRLPLSGRCERCGGTLLLTIYPRSTTKYVESAIETLDNYGLKGYVHQRLKLLQEEARAMFFLAERSKREKLGEEVLREAETVREKKLIDFL